MNTEHTLPGYRDTPFSGAAGNMDVLYTGTVTAKGKEEERRWRAFRGQKKDVHIRNTGQGGEGITLFESLGRAMEGPKSHRGRNVPLSFKGNLILGITGYSFMT